MKYLSAPGLPREAEGRWQWRGLAARYTRCCTFSCLCIVCGPWSCRPQPLGDCREAVPCEDTRQEHGPQFELSVAGCLLMAPAQDEAGQVVGVRWAHRALPQAMPRRGGTEEESKRGAAWSEPHSPSAAPAPDG